jgi:hypothetical protein
MAELYRRALEATDALMTACAAREESVLSHGRALENVGGSEHLLWRGDGRTVLAFAGETYESGHYAPPNLLALLIDQVNGKHRVGLRHYGLVGSGHPVLRYLEAGEEL